MKRVYERPAVYVEAVGLDKPIALNCTANKDDMWSLIKMGYFNDYCELNVEENPPPYDTICYHGNIDTAFTS